MAILAIVVIGVFAVILLFVSSKIFVPCEVRIESVKNSSDTRAGLRFYRPAPYLLVTGEKDKSWTASIVALPDKSEEYVLYVTKGWSKVDLKASLEQGWNLTSVGAATESQVPAMITAVGGLVTEAVPPRALDLGLYQIVLEKDKEPELRRVKEG